MRYLARNSSVSKVFHLHPRFSKRLLNTSSEISPVQAINESTCKLLVRELKNPRVRLVLRKREIQNWNAKPLSVIELLIIPIVISLLLIPTMLFPNIMKYLLLVVPLFSLSIFLPYYFVVIRTYTLSVLTMFKKVSAGNNYLFRRCVSIQFWCTNVLNWYFVSLVSIFFYREDDFVKLFTILLLIACLGCWVAINDTIFIFSWCLQILAF